MKQVERIFQNTFIKLVERKSKKFLKVSANRFLKDYNFHKLYSHQKWLKKHMLGNIIKMSKNSKTEKISFPVYARTALGHIGLIYYVNLADALTFSSKFICPRN